MDIWSVLGDEVATLEWIQFQPHRSSVRGLSVEWTPVKAAKAISGLPQLCWADNTPWREANLWALERATGQEVTLKTVAAGMTALHAYAKWLESTDAKWWDFPLKKSGRCLVRYRKALIDSRDKGELAPSTVSERMAVVVQFYRWLNSTALLSTDGPIWQERTVGVHLTDAVGFTRTVAVRTTDLSIPNRKAPGERLEDGLLPVSVTDRTSILVAAKKHASEELFLMLTTGFFSGARLGTIADLRIGTLERAAPDPATPELMRISVGPGADPPVHTKRGVSGHIHITKANLEALREYFYSTRRLKRQASAKAEHRDLIFLTRFGNPYVNRGSDKSSALNVEMHTFRKLASPLGLPALRHFHFHQSRCTFATELARLAIKACGAINALHIVKVFLLHKHESTSMRYIKFVENAPAKERAADAFTRDFLGAIAGQRIIAP